MESRVVVFIFLSVLTLISGCSPDTVELKTDDKINNVGTGHLFGTVDSATLLLKSPKLTCKFVGSVSKTIAEYEFIGKVSPDSKNCGENFDFQYEFQFTAATTSLSPGTFICSNCDHFVYPFEPMLFWHPIKS